MASHRYSGFRKTFPRPEVSSQVEERKESCVVWISH